MEVLRRHRSFIFQSKLKDQKDTIGIFDLNMNLLACCKHEHTWRTPRGPIKVRKQARVTDIYFESSDGTLLCEINEIPPKFGSARLIRKFEIYVQKKELVGAVREKPKFVGSDWELTNLDERTIALMVGDRKKKDYEINSPNGQVLARCYKDSSLDTDSYRIDVLSSSVDLFLILCYVVVLDLAKTAWITRPTPLFGNTQTEKEHLVKTRLAEEKKRKAQASESSKNANVNAILSFVQASLLFILATFFIKPIFYDDFIILFIAFGIAILVTAFIGVSFVKLNQFNKVAILAWLFGFFSLPFGGFLLSGDFMVLTSESTFLIYGLMIVGFGMMVNIWALIGLFDDLIKK